MTPCDFGAAALPNSNALCRAKARKNISTLALKLSRDHQMLISENSGTIDGNRHTPPALR